LGVVIRVDLRSPHARRGEAEEEENMRVIKRYLNRKLYDTQDSRYVTLEQLAHLVRQGEEIRVVDKSTDKDLTSATLAQIIFEEEKRSPKLPIEGLKQIIRGGLPAA
jgi:polyhydroxyalkanoate synthesis repressor PhaR